MTPQEAAAKLNNSEYRAEGSPELFAQMKAAGLVAIFGASDDLMEIRGAVRDEIGSYHGSRVHFTKSGMITNDCEEDHCPYYKRLLATAEYVEAIWDTEGYSWIFETAIPYATFDVLEDGHKYCRGIVFALVDVP